MSGNKMNSKTFRLTNTLTEIKNAIDCLFENGYKWPALLNIFSLIDICSSICMAETIGNAQRYKAYLKKCMMPKIPGTCDITLEEYWAMRCSVLHAYRSVGDNTDRQGLRLVYFYSNEEEKVQIAKEIEKRDSRKYILMDLESVKLMARDALNYLLVNCETDKEIKRNIEIQADTILSDYSSYRIENFIKSTL